MQASFYATPIIYPLAVVIEKSEQAAKFLMLNPVAQAIQDARYSLITKETITASQLFNNPLYIILPFMFVIIIFICGVAYFRKNSKYFAENI